MLSSGLVRELKTSTSALETFGARAAKLASQLHQTAASFGSFVDALQTISDSVNTVNGVSRDIGAALTRFCLRQRAVETAIRKWSEILQKNCADDLGRRGSEWRQTISDLERRHQRNCKRFKTSGGGKHNKNRQQIEGENRNFYIELLHAQRTQCTEFVVGTLLPVINAQMVLLDEGSHIQPILDSIEKSVNENDTNRMIQTLLEDIDNGTEKGEHRIGLAMAQSRAKSASQAHLYGVGSTERTEENDHFSATTGPCHSLDYDASSSSLLMTANRNSMPPPSNSHFVADHFFSSCPSSAVATISSASSPFCVINPSLASKGNSCVENVDGNAAMVDGMPSEDIWQQNNTAPSSSHQRLPLSKLFVRHQQMPSTDQNAAVLSPPSPSTHSADNLSHQIYCQKPPMPTGWSRTNSSASHCQPPLRQQQNTRNIGPSPSQLNNGTTMALTSTAAGREMQQSLSPVQSHGAMPIGTNYPPFPPVDQKASTQSASSTLLSPPAQHTDSTDSGSHCSSALMAETLQQIDQLGLELNNYCDGLEDMGNVNCGERKQPFAIPSQSHCQRAFVAEMDVAVRFRSSAAATAVPPPFPKQSCALADALPPPLPPQRRNSAISSATPSAPSIAQLRSIGAAVVPFGPSPLPLTALPKGAVLHAPVAVPPSPCPLPLPSQRPPVRR